MLPNTHRPRRIAFLLPLLGLLLAGAAAAAGLRPYTATYEVSRNGDAIGEATVSLRAAPGGWSYDSQTRGTHGVAALAAADISEHSELRSTGGALETRSYRYRMSTLLKTRERRIDVDPAAGRIVSIDKGNERDFPMQAGVLDQSAVTLAIAADLAAGKRGTLSYPVASRNDVSTQRYLVGAEQMLNLPAGTMRAIAVKRIRDSSGGRTTTSWFGADNGFVPVRIEQTEPDGEILEMRLVSLRR